MKAKIPTTLSRRASVLLSASVGALAMTAPAFAQDEDRGGLDQITVTATRSETNLQDTPLAITAVTTGAKSVWSTAKNSSYTISNPMALAAPISHAPTWRDMMQS